MHENSDTSWNDIIEKDRIRCNILQKKEVEKIFKQVKFDTLQYCCGMTSGGEKHFYDCFNLRTMLCT